MKNQVMWEKPQKIMTTEQWLDISADGAPPGVYTPNMSKSDMLKWKGTLKGKTTASPYVELRKTFQQTNNNNINYCSQVLIIVSRIGYKGMKKTNIVISMNGKTAMSFKEMQELQHAIYEAQIVLKNIG